MKRSLSKPPSPTNTTYSGLSSYRTARTSGPGAPAVPNIDYRQVSKIHYEELSVYLAAYLARAPANSRNTARAKLTRLTIQQFHELSTDVYDELIRRKARGMDALPFLPVREEFHPKRNQARQKLATLPTTRFEDLSSDVYFELGRRYPEFKEDPNGGYSSQDYSQAYGGSTASPSVSNPPPRGASRISNRSDDRPPDSGYGGSISGRPSAERSRRKPSDDLYNTQDDYPPRRSLSRSSRRKPSQDTTRSYDRPPASVTGSDSTAGPAGGVGVGRDVIIPNKSTIEEEYIEVPYGRDSRVSPPPPPQPRDRTGSLSRNRDPGFDEPDSASVYNSPDQNGFSGLSGLSQRLGGSAARPDEDDDASAYDDSPLPSGNKFGMSMGMGMGGGLRRSGSAASRSSAGGGGKRVDAEEVEKVKSDYEFRIASMEKEMAKMERELSEKDSLQSEVRGAGDRRKALETELEMVKRRADDQNASLRAMQQEIDTLKREREKDIVRRRDDDEEIKVLRERLDEEIANNESGGGGADPEIVRQLQGDMQGLLSELGDLSRRNDDLMSDKDNDRTRIRSLEKEVQEWRRRYETVKTELRGVKATSQLFTSQRFGSSAAEVQDHLPTTSNGGIADANVTFFLTSIDSLLTAARSSSPANVLSPMKNIVNAVSALIADLDAFLPGASDDIDIDGMNDLRDRLEATLSNLVAVSKTHATSAGMSPVSLLDAAASHVSACVTEIGKGVGVRRGNPSQPSSSPTLKMNGTPPKVNGSSSNTSGRWMPQIPGSLSTGKKNLPRRPPSDNSSSERTNSPPAIFDNDPAPNGIASDDSVEGDPWGELKPYLEAQTDAIVYAIQQVLSAVRTPNPSPTQLTENLTQIITIVSSIVAVCNDNFPASSAGEGRDILRDLGQHADKLSELQERMGSGEPGVMGKENKQVMAKSSFAIANAMKALMKL